MTDNEPSFDAPCRFPGTAATAPTVRAACSLRYPLRDPTLFTAFGGARAPHVDRFTCSARTTRRRSGKGSPPNGPGRLLSCLEFAVPAGSFRHQLPANQLRASSRRNDSARSLRTDSPSTRHCPRQRCNGFLPARSYCDWFVTQVSLGDSPMPATQDASDRLLPLVTLTTSTHASCVPDS